MKIYLRELSDQDTELDFSQDEAWVTQAVERVDEMLDDPKLLSPASNPQKKAGPRPVHAHFNLRKVDDVVVVDGQVETYIRLFCSRCAAEFRMEAHPEFSALFCKDPVMAGVAHEAGGKVVGATKGFARHAHDSTQDAVVEAGKDLDITYLSQDFIDLADVLTEQLQLQVPFQPLCKESCKGMCTTCGADLNVGRCACAKLSKETPFSVLRDFKA